MTYDDVSGDSELEDDVVCDDIDNDDDDENVDDELSHCNENLQPNPNRSVTI